MLIAEELFLLLRRDDGKPESMTAQRGYGLAAAVVTDLVARRADHPQRRQGPADDGARAAARRPPRARRRARPARASATGKKLSSLVIDRKLAVEARWRTALGGCRRDRRGGEAGAGARPGEVPRARPRARAPHPRAAAGGAAGRHPPHRRTRPCWRSSRASGSSAKVLAEEKGALGRRDLKRRIEEVSTEAPVGDAVAQGRRGDEHRDHDGRDPPRHRGRRRRRAEAQPEAGRSVSTRTARSVVKSLSRNPTTLRHPVEVERQQPARPRHVRGQAEVEVVAAPTSSAR